MTSDGGPPSLTALRILLVLVGIIGGSLLAGHYGWIRPLRPL